MTTLLDTSTPDAPVLTKKDVSRRVGVSTRTVDRLVARRAITFHRIGDLIRFSQRVCGCVH